MNKPKNITEKGSNEYSDPTYNVLQLVHAAVERLTDNINLHKEISDLNVAHARELREAESKRLDALRVGDMGSVTLANEKASAQASLLANQLQQYEERNRNLVGTTATTIVTQLTGLINPIVNRLESVEKFQYENRGKGQGIKDFRDWIPWVITIGMFLYSLYKNK